MCSRAHLPLPWRRQRQLTSAMSASELAAGPEDAQVDQCVPRVRQVKTTNILEKKDITFEERPSTDSKRHSARYAETTFSRTARISRSGDIEMMEELEEDNRATLTSLFMSGKSQAYSKADKMAEDDVPAPMTDIRQSTVSTRCSQVGIDRRGLVFFSRSALHLTLRGREQRRAEVCS